jgi:hypothetical protein
MDDNRGNMEDQRENVEDQRENVETNNSIAWKTARAVTLPLRKKCGFITFEKKKFNRLITMMEKRTRNGMRE